MRFSDSHDRIALYEQTGDAPVTLAQVKAVIAELRAHSEQCDCGLCSAAWKTTAVGAMHPTIHWSRIVNKTGRQAQS